VYYELENLKLALKDRDGYSDIFGLQKCTVLCEYFSLLYRWMESGLISWSSCGSLHFEAINYSDGPD